MNWPEVSDHNLPTIHPEFLIMTTKSFPPADDILAMIGRIDWKQVGQIAVEGVDNFLEIIEQIVMFIVAFCTVSITLWKRHSVTSKIINAVKVSYAHLQTGAQFVVTTGVWLLTVAYPQCRKMAQKVYTLAKATYGVLSDTYCLLTARQFTIL